jgi:hypothetical protein
VCYTLKRKAYYKEHYARYGDTYRARAKARKIAVKQVTRQKLAEYLIDKCCAHCGNSDSRVLEFDHLDAANKSFGISRAFDNSLSWERILAEIQKCQILCANCHRIRTAEQFGWSKSVR